MKFTFGIITGGGQEGNISMIIDSIERQNIPEYEIIVVGACNLIRDKLIVIPFDETIKDKWITKKKNIITSLAKYENVVYSHDYVIYEPGWYAGHLKSGDNFQVRMDKIINPDGTRFRDWLLCMMNNNHVDDIVGPGRNCLIPYDMDHLSKYMYISGTYWVAKKTFMLEFPLNENLSWGDGEDGEWSFRVRQHIEFKMNQNSVVKLLKHKPPMYSETHNVLNDILNSII